ncbi:hypothetical protein L226DRAFT_528065 [Lentinus tigrinus ALCF2SS1-7]|uniref:uncharacterized protein n=1 Tax=Lentinus tigrinus ALCF2SS1-7 TaxID=1328758 RepID=UPI001165D5D4|nr:hypothetical protein L226DRAFT_528065 [Lentinus tigrinus ALCF2SS1-7]
MPPSGSSSQHKKNLAVKRQDGEPLTRVDLQYDLLYSLFTDKHAVFTDPYTTIRGDPAGTKVTFRDLYVNALIHSPRCSKASRDKIREAPDFGNEFAMISLLSNVGRINTTMAFFPEMKTALRTYHPVPALQRTNGNLQDAPRIKNILKTCFLPDEAQGMVTTPNDVLARSRSGKVPPTSIVNLIFVFASHSVEIARTHFAPRAPVEFLDLFTPVNVSSQSRARAFLWLCHHFHEASTPNPFSDADPEGYSDRAPPFVQLSREEAAAENVDTAEEHQRGLDMADLRRRFLETKAKEELAKDSEGELARPQTSGSKGRGRGKGKELADIGPAFRTREVSPADSQYSMPYAHREEDMLEGPGRPPLRRVPSPRPQYLGDRRPPTPPYRRHPLRDYSPEATASPRAAADPYPRRPLSPNVDPLQHSNGKPLRTQSRKPRGHASQTPLFVHEPYQYPSGRPSYSRPVYAAPKYAPPSPETPKRTMLEQAWHVSMTTDPLMDSDDEMYVDENTRLDYVLRLRIISRLRGKEPTPPRELGPTYNMNPVNPMIALGTR